MHRILFFALMLLAAGAVPAAAQTTTDEAAVRALIERLGDAMNAHDAEAHAAVYADGAQIFWGSGEVHTVGDRAAFVEGGRQWHAENAALRFERTAMTVRFLDDDTATVFASGTGYVGDDVTGNYSVLFVVQRTPAGWRIAAEHDAVIPPAEG